MIELMILIFTGNGKGKTTAAIGLCIRVELYQTGIGFSWKKTPQQQIESIKCAWELCKKVLLCEKYDIIILDEIINIFCMRTISVANFLNEKDLIAVLQKVKNTTDVVLTGRNASQILIDYADLVTDMKEIKHYYKKGIKAKKGLEY